MLNRTTLPIAIAFLVIMLIVSLPTTAFSEVLFKRSVAYRISGQIDSTSRIGSMYYTGSTREQSIRGYGEVTKSETVRIAPYIMRVEDNIRWITFQDALRNITVITNIQLCARPISAAVYNYDSGHGIIRAGNLVNPYLPVVIEGNLITLPQSRQMWYTRISSDPGHHGRFRSEYVSAYGPGPYDVNRPNYDPDRSWWFEGITRLDYGDYYVGNYFEIDQYIHTSSGDTRRFIDMSNPFIYAQLTEVMRLVGSLTVWEDFKMRSIPLGPDAVTMHWSDFDLFF